MKVGWGRQWFAEVSSPASLGVDGAGDSNQGRATAITASAGQLRRGTG